MALTVRTDLAALRSINRLNNTQNSLSGSLERISSGLRVNKAADDAAGLAFLVEWRQTMFLYAKPCAMPMMVFRLCRPQKEPWVKSPIFFQRMRELSIQSSNGTYSASDRLLIDKEFVLMKNEIRQLLLTRLSTAFPCWLVEQALSLSNRD